MQVVFRTVYKVTPDFTNTPFRAPTPVPTIIAVGVASPSAHGHAATTVAMKKLNANETREPSCGIHDYG